MKWFSCLAVAGVLVTGRLSAADNNPVLEEIVAKVNGDIVTFGEIERTKRQIEAELRTSQNLTGVRLQTAVQEREKDILRERIDQLLLVQKGKELAINVDSELSRYMADLQRKFQIADPDKFQAFVREQTGLPYEDYRAEQKNAMITQKVIRDQVGRTINVPREEMQKYYNDHKDEFMRHERVFLRQIIVSTEGKDAAGIAAAEKKAKDLSARAKKGEKFPELARDNSDNPTTAQQGGDMGNWQKGALRKEIEDLIWDKPRGYVSDPIKVQEGFLILKVDEHQKEGLASYDEVEPEIQDKFYSQAFQPKIRDFLTKLRQDAFLEIKPGWVDTGAAPGKETAWQDPAQLKPETIKAKEVAQTPHFKKLFRIIPMPGTTTERTGTSSSK
ncbi:MAG TPA: peptidylprolyl isomerase [Bryobacteraceae bacterium]|jgi:parvulin-like peptidyl-prolyl isomerase